MLATSPEGTIQSRIVDYMQSKEFVSEYEIQHYFRALSEESEHDSAAIVAALTDLENDKKILSYSLRNVRVFRLQLDDQELASINKRKLVQREISTLEIKLKTLQTQYKRMTEENTEIDPAKEYKKHIERLHVYNEIKDVAQMLFGKCAQIEGLTTKDMYEKFGMDLND